MKRISIIFGLAAVLLSSCGKDPLPVIDPVKVTEEISAALTKDRYVFPDNAMFYIKYEPGDSILSVDAVCVRKETNDTVSIIWDDRIEPGDSTAFLAFNPESERPEKVLGEYVVKGTVRKGTAKPVAFSRKFTVDPKFELSEIKDTCLYSHTVYKSTLTFLPAILYGDITAETDGDLSVEVVRQGQSTCAVTVTTGESGMAGVTFHSGTYILPVQFKVRSYYSISVAPMSNNLIVFVGRGSSKYGAEKVDELSKASSVTLSAVSRSTVEYRKDNTLSVDRLSNPPVFKDTSVVSISVTASFESLGVHGGMVSFRSEDIDRLVALKTVRSIEYNGKMDSDSEGNEVPNFDSRDIRYSPLDLVFTVDYTIDDREAFTTVSLTDGITGKSFSYWDKDKVFLNTNYTYLK